MVNVGERVRVRVVSLVISILLLLLLLLAADVPCFHSDWGGYLLLGQLSGRWEKVYSHDNTGVPIVGHHQALPTAVTSGDVIRVVIHSIPQFQMSQNQTQTSYNVQADNAVINRDQVCIQAVSIYNLFNDHFPQHSQGDSRWYLQLCSGTGNLHVLGVQLGTQRVISDLHVSASATWYVRSWAIREESRCFYPFTNENGDRNSDSDSDTPFCESRTSSRLWPVYSHFLNGEAVGGKRISTLLEAVKRGQDVRATMRDRGYSFPMHAVHWSEGEKWVGGHSISHVGQRHFPSHVSMRTQHPYLWISSWSTSGKRQNSRWALHSHVSQGANQDAASLDWMTDACWRHVYTNDARGQRVLGSLEDLLVSVRGGHRVRVVVDNMASEADVIRIRGGHLAAQLLSRLTPVSFTKDFKHLRDDARWNWNVVHTTGTLWQHEVLLSNHSIISQSTTSTSVSWFVDSRPWTKQLSLTNQNVTSGHVTDVSDAVLDGATVRIKIRHTSNNGETFAPAANLKVVFADDGVAVTSAQMLRYFGDEEIGDSEVRLHEQLIWWITSVDTKGVMSVYAWDTAQKFKYFEMSITPEIDWFVNK